MRQPRPLGRAVYKANSKAALSPPLYAPPPSARRLLLLGVVVDLTFSTSQACYIRDIDMSL